MKKICPPIREVDSEKFLRQIERDEQYEWLYLYREDGSLFISGQLRKKISQICRLSCSLDTFEGNDPLIYLKSWEKEKIQYFVAELTDFVREELALYRKALQNFRKLTLISSLQRALFALQLSGCHRESSNRAVQKNSIHYFCDFLSLFCTFLSSQEFRQLQEKFLFAHSQQGQAILQLVHALCRGFFLLPSFTHLYGELLQKLIGSREQREESLSAELSFQYEALSSTLKKHPNGPIYKILDLLLEKKVSPFDPLGQLHLSYVIYTTARGTKWIHLPSPTIQMHVREASLHPIFERWMHSYRENGQKHLLINLQDRDAYPSVARHLALARGAKSSPYFLYSLPMNTPFYWQQFNEEKEMDIALFFSSLLQQWEEEELPESETCSLLFREIHTLFFPNKITLWREERLNFIDLFHLFLSLKWIEQLQPHSFSFTCKDGIDRSSMMEGLLFFFLHDLEKIRFDQEETSSLSLLLFIPALILRQRVPQRERFVRFLSLFHRIESVFEREEEKRTCFHNCFPELSSD